MRSSAFLGTFLLIFSAAEPVFAADDQLLKQAQSVFQPIPLKPPPIKDVAATPSMVELGKALFFRSALITEPQHQLQHVPSGWPWRCRHVVNLDRAQMAKGRSQRAHSS